MRARAGMLALLVALVVLLVPQAAWAGKRSMIPPGHEEQIRALVEAAVAEARAAGELPVAVDEEVGVMIDRDRIRVFLSPRDADPDAAMLPRPTLFHPEVIPADAGVALAAGVVLECGSVELPLPCVSEDLIRAWTPLARRLAAGFEPHVGAIWAVEETGVLSRGGDAPEPPRRDPVELASDRLGLLVALGLGLALLVAGVARPLREGPGRAPVAELVGLLGLLALFVGAALSQTAMLPLHEHNSFIARSDCAIDPRCVDDAAWSMTAMSGYGALLERIPYRAGALARLSLGLSVLVLALAWALARELALALGRPRLAGVAGLATVAVLASDPVVWRLSGAATFWPWNLAWALAAAWAGLWAARASAAEDRRARLRGAAAWLLAAICLAYACAGNLVCLSLAPCFVLAPLCWARAPLRSRLVRGVALGVPALAVFALLSAHDYVFGFASVFGEDRLDDSVRLARLVHDFNPLLLQPRLVTPIWALAVIAGLVLWLRTRDRSASPGDRRVRVLVPLAYAYLVPAAYLGLAAGDLIGSGYPVGFINHHWELVWTAVFAGLLIAVGVAALERRWPEAAARPGLRWLILAGLTLAALLLAPASREGWRMATGERVLERELLALERSFAALPEHDRLVVAPRILAAMTDAPSSWDALEVVFPVGFYEHAMRERGRSPALVVGLDRMTPPRPGERILVYVGSSLRSFQPHEIAAGAVPDSLEREELARLRDEWALEPVHEFAIATAQHEAISQRLGADRVPEIELGFYWMRRLD